MKPSGQAWSAALLAIAVADLATPGHALAADRHWNVGTGLWTTAANWSPAVVPNGVDNAFVDFFSGGSGGVARLNTTNVPALTSITVSNSGVFSINGSGLSAGSILVGTDVVLGRSSLHGTLNLLDLGFFGSIGGMTIVDSLRVGVLSGSGTVSHGAGTLIVGNQVILGDTRQSGSMFDPGGVYTMSGGFLRTPKAEIGSHASAFGTFNISGSAILDVNDMNIGDRGTGAVNQTGGTNGSDTVTIGTSLITPTGGTKVYNMSGGTINCNITQILRNGVLNFTGGTINGHVHLNANGRLNVNGGVMKCSSLWFNDPLAVVEIGDDKIEIAINQTAEHDELQDGLRRGYNGGAWNGNGMTSTAARLDPEHITAVGWGLVGGKILVRYTYFGDADVDGKVDGDDYARIDASFNRQLTQGNIGYWWNGDFNYDGRISGGDYALIDSAFNAQNGTILRMLSFLDGTDRDRSDMTSPGLQMTLAHFNQFGESYAIAALSSIPEPTSVLLLALAGLQRRRRR